MQFPFIRHVTSEAETVKLAKMFSLLLKKGDCVSLVGNMGSGKTFFTKALCKEFEINDANSPTFALLNVYEGKEKFYHFDFYRMKSEEELLNIGIFDYLNDSDGITIIEWSDLFPQALPKNRYEIVIAINEDFSRTFTFQKL